MTFEWLCGLVRVADTCSHSPATVASPPRKRARLSDEGVSLGSQRPRPPLSVEAKAEARKRRQAAIAAVLTQGDAADSTTPTFLASTPGTSRDGLVNTTNLVLSPPRASSAPPPIVNKSLLPSETATGPSRSVENLSQASSSFGSPEIISMSSHIKQDSDDPFISKLPESFTSDPVNNENMETDNREVTPPPATITQIAVGVFYTASQRPLEVSADALAQSRAFSARMDAGKDDDDDIASIAALKASFFASSQRPRQLSKLPFRPPLISTQRSSSSAPLSIAPQTINRPPLASSSSTPLTRPATTQLPFSTQPSASSSSTPVRRPQLPSSSQSAFARPSTPMGKTPQRHLGMTNGKGTPGPRAAFVTPFKSAAGSTPTKSTLSTRKLPGSGAGMVLPAVRSSLGIASSSSRGSVASSQISKSTERSTPIPKAEILPPNACFDIREFFIKTNESLSDFFCWMRIGKRNDRMPLRRGGVIAGVYSLQDLANRGVCGHSIHYRWFLYLTRSSFCFFSPDEVPMITPSNAPDYAFYQDDGKGGYIPQGCAEALSYLRNRGCTLATPEWVTVHWSLVLWKKASLVCCHPESLNDFWKFESVCEGLMYQ